MHATAAMLNLKDILKNNKCFSRKTKWGLLHLHWYSY